MRDGLIADRDSQLHLFRKYWVITLLLSGLICIALVGITGWMSRCELIGSFLVTPNQTLKVYAESEFLYDPPGYLYFELEQGDKTVIPQRRFMSIGSERKPQQPFTLIQSSDKEVVALALGNEIQIIHEFSSGFTWPGALNPPDAGRSRWD